MIGERQIPMHLIGDNDDAIFDAYIPQGAQLISCPNPGNWIVRIAQIDHLGLRCSGFSFKVSKIHRVSTIVQYQGIGDQSASVLPQDIEEIEKHWWLNDDPVADFRENRGGHGQRIQHILCTKDMFLIDLPTVAVLKPSRQRR